MPCVAISRTILRRRSGTASQPRRRDGFEFTIRKPLLRHVREEIREPWGRRASTWRKNGPNPRRSVFRSGDDTLAVRAELRTMLFLENGHELAAFNSPLKVVKSLPLVASHTRTVWSAEVVTTRRASGSNSALYTLSSCPFRVVISLPLLVSHTRAVLSQEAVTIR